MASIRDAYAHIVSTLGGDATLNSLGVGSDDIFALKSPESHPTPFIILERPAGRRHHVLSKEAIQEHWVVIKCVDSGTDGGDRARQIMDRINTLLTGTSFSVTNGYYVRMAGITELEYIESETGNIQFFHVGTMFKVLLGNN